MVFRDSAVANDQALIQLRNVSKIYDSPFRTPVLSNITIDIYPGEIVSIIGPSGCGKTTLLRLVAGFIQSTTGEVLVCGAPVRGPGHDRTMIFQEHNLFPWKTVIQNVGFGLKARSIPDDQRTNLAQKYIDLVQLSGFEHHFPHQLSVGMRQRVAIARALVVHPVCILMDEPFGSLDALTRSHLQDELLKILLVKKTTVIFVTHDIEEAIYLADRVFVLSFRPGTIQKEFKIALNRPRNPAIRLSNEFLDLKSLVLAELGGWAQCCMNE